MRHLVVFALAILMAVAAAWPADALTVDQVEGFSGQFDFVGVTPFDPALGTLDRVRVTISGVLTVSGMTGLNLLPLGPGGLQPVPYDYVLDVQQDFFGLGNRYFDFSNVATFRFTGHATGAGEALLFVEPFSYAFTFDAFSDLIGFALPMTTGDVIPPPGGIAGTRARFIDNGIPLNEIDLTHAFTLSGQQPLTTPTTITTLSSAGQLQISYDVPEPSSLALLGAALVVAAHRAITRRPRSSRR